MNTQVKDRRVSLAVEERRSFLVKVSSVTALTLVGCVPGSKSPEHEGKEAEVTPAEDLMQEHAVLDRILLIYEETASRLETAKTFDLSFVGSSAAIVRRFVEQYHEKQEEEFVFPRLEKAGKELELVATLKDQHLRGRSVTDRVISMIGAGGTPNSATLAGLLRSFVRMYRPHAAREGSVLFPAFRETLDKDGYDELGEKFEDREHQLFGAHGFEDTVAEVSKIETALGIHDLAAFSPP